MDMGVVPFPTRSGFAARTLERRCSQTGQADERNGVTSRWDAGGVGGTLGKTTGRSSRRTQMKTSMDGSAITAQGTIGMQTRHGRATGNKLAVRASAEARRAEAVALESPKGVEARLTVVQTRHKRWEVAATWKGTGGQMRGARLAEDREWEEVA